MYLSVLLSLLKLSAASLQNESLLDQLKEILTDCYQAIQNCHFQHPFDKDVAILQLKLLLWWTAPLKKVGNLDLFTVEGAKVEPSRLLNLCIQDGCPLPLRTFCLEFVNTTCKDFNDDVINYLVVDSLHAESDPDYLIQVW